MMERQFQVVERQTQVAEHRSGPFRLNLTTGLRSDAWELIPSEALSAGEGLTQLSWHTTQVGRMAGSVNSQRL